MTGRPSLYSEELADLICEDLGNGKSLREICKAEGMPDRSTVLRWMQTNEAFATKCARTREGPQAEHVVDEIVEVEKGALAGTITSDIARVLISSKQWRASKLAPKKYGEKLETTVKGDPDNPLAVKDVSAREFIASRILSVASSLRAGEDTGGSDGSAG
jgi:hypothetical protein